MKLEALIETPKGPLRTADVLRSIAKSVREIRKTRNGAYPPRHVRMERLAEQVDRLANTLDGVKP